MSDLKDRAIQIREEKIIEKNSASRVGGFLVDLVTNVESITSIQYFNYQSGNLDEYNRIDLAGIYYVISDSKKVVGVLHVIGSNDNRTIQQLLVGNYTHDNGTMNWSHTDGEVNILVRSFNINAPNNFVPINTWGKWQYYSGDFNVLKNIPSVNGVQLSGNKESKDCGLANNKDAFCELLNASDNVMDSLLGDEYEQYRIHFKKGSLPGYSTGHLFISKRVTNQGIITVFQTLFKEGRIKIRSGVIDLEGAVVWEEWQDYLLNDSGKIDSQYLDGSLILDAGNIESSDFEKYALLNQLIVVKYNLSGNNARGLLISNPIGTGLAGTIYQTRIEGGNTYIRAGDYKDGEDVAVWGAWKESGALTYETIKEFDF